jgi:glutathione S-transferase
MGKDLREQVEIEMWNRRMELNFFAPVSRAFQHTNPLFKGRLQQFPEYGATQLETSTNQLKWLDAQIGDKPFIAGNRYTIADITALVALEFGEQMAGLKIDPALKNLNRWHQSVASRPSAKA